jgi:hypothetical protein
MNILRQNIENKDFTLASKYPGMNILRKRGGGGVGGATPPDPSSGLSSQRAGAHNTGKICEITLQEFAQLLLDAPGYVPNCAKIHHFDMAQ